MEKVADESVHGQEALCLTGRFEPSHVSLALPCGLVGDFGAIVLVSVRAMGDRRHDRFGAPPCSTAQLVAVTNRLGLTLLAASTACGKSVWPPDSRVATGPEDIDDVAILIDGTPEIVPPSLDGDEDLVQVPSVAQPVLWVANW